MQRLGKIVKNTWGDKGQLWLNQLPSLIETLVKHWSLTGIKSVNNMNYNYVALATQENNIPVVLKISCDEELITNEYHALKHFAGNGAVRVIDRNKEYHALLLEQAVPGFILKENHPKNINETIKIYADVVKSLASCPFKQNNFQHVSIWCKAIDRIQPGKIERLYVAKATELKSFLLASSENEYLCHGDLHLENIIQDGKTWLAIDPKGIVGEMAFEAAAFDLINKDEMKKIDALSDKIIDRVAQLSKELNLDYNRLLSWIFLRVIISAQWFIEDNGDPSDMLVLAKTIYSMLGK